MRCLSLLWAEIFELYLGRKSGSRLSVEVVDGARYQAKQTIELSDEELEGIAGGQEGCFGRFSWRKVP